MAGFPMPRHSRHPAAMSSRLLRLVVLALGFAGCARLTRAVDFANDVAPLFETRCLSCHRGLAARGGFSLETAAEALRGGDSGPAFAPGDSASSLLVDMISGQEPAMPKEGAPLTADEVAKLRAWIDDGAPWPADTKLTDKSPDALSWWSLQPLVRPNVPAATDATPADWPRNEVDAFVLQKLSERGLRPSPSADRRTLVRRVTYDLTGLPPTPAEVAAFIADDAADAYERLVDRLLASPHYGERWARHWLDVVHFGETHGYDKDKRRDNAWPYRDWVIRALNEDLPYAEFARLQIAGDALAPDDPWAAVATGLVAAGPWDFVGHVELAEGTVEKAKTRVVDRDDMLATTMAAFCSLTAHCARCHDHPFDPIPQHDYYRLQAVFAGAERGDRPVAGLPFAAVYAVNSIEPRPIQVLARGDVERAGDTVEPGAIAAVAGLDADFSDQPHSTDGERRAALAAWVASPDNPLFWRSIVNRVWQHHFGRGLVDTPNDFGRNGSRPTHAELLDWLAVEFRDGGGSLKALHKRLVMSSAYRQASDDRANGAALDAENRLLWRAPRRRLSAEEVRDSLLAASGQLDRRRGGPSYARFDFEDDHSPRYKYLAVDRPETWRRSIYQCIVRSAPDPWMEALDCADASASTPVRSETVTVLGALALWNDPFVLSQAQRMADTIERDPRSAEEAVDEACRRALGQTLPAEPRARLIELARRQGLASACRVLFNSNAFLFVD